MNKMFVVKYPASVDNENLVPIGTLRIKHYKVDNPTASSQYFVGSLLNNSKIAVSNGLEILSSDLKTSKGTRINGNTGEAAISNGDGYIDIDNKYELLTLNLGSSFWLNLNDIKYSTNLTTLSLNSTQITGTLSDLANLTNLTTLNLGSTQITGTLSDLANLTNLTTLHIVSTQITGTWEDFIKKERDKGRTSGRISSYWNFSGATLNGTSIRSNTPSGKITISWNSNSVTLEGTANDGTFNV